MSTSKGARSDSIIPEQFPPIQKFQRGPDDITNSPTLSCTMQIVYFSLSRLYLICFDMQIEYIDTGFV